ncbi:methytransferase partner Trm112 [Methanomassiliicoccus luminyensis]|jgi:uncharacterized protein YbaR (Trm112 family)|uniref:methytransferase partner Trm112 n=1 Tax=Methanomassiliicoccus luminyensis TaxID=1080712 RepID=UPI00037D8D6A|nr:methytransferase partner Trm112 [Methanomassiliicoccus luminyensis]
MKRQLMNILACPVCKRTPLDLEVFKESDKGIEEGRLTCPQCRREYSISEGIPDMLPSEKK